MSHIKIYWDITISILDSVKLINELFFGVLCIIILHRLP